MSAEVVQELRAVVKEYSDGVWIIDLDNGGDDTLWDFCWAGTADFRSNRVDQSISRIVVLMNKDRS